MFERFTDRARRVMGLANQEAMRFNHESIGTEHILLGLIKEGSGVAANVLRNLGVDFKRVREEIEKKVPPGHDMVTMGRLPFTPRAKKVIELAFEEARNLKHNYIGTEHLILGLLRESEGVAAQVLVEQNLKLEEVREEVLRLIDHGSSDKGPLGGDIDKALAGPASAPRQEISRYDVKARHVMSLANQEALRFNHESLGTEHILLGIIKEGSGVAANVLRNLGVDFKRVSMEIEKKVPPGRDVIAQGCLPLTMRAKKAIELAFEESRSLSHNYVGTEHLLLGLLRESDGLAAKILVEQNLKLDEVREEVLRLVGHGFDKKGASREEPHEEPGTEGKPVLTRGQEIRKTLEVLLEIAKEDPSTGRMVTVGHLPFSITAAKVIESAFEEARSLGRDYVNNEHLLLGLFDEKDGLVGKVFEKTGLTKDQLREELLRLMGKKPDGGKNV